MGVQYNHFPAVKAALHDAASKIVRKTLFDLLAEMQRRTVVLTGFLKSSEYVVTHNESTYGQGAMPGPMLPEIDRPPNDTTGYAAVGAEYGAYVELGTSRMAAQPFMVPAADAIRPGFLAALGALEEALRKAAERG